jgi:biopolymer transport protein ExbD
MPKVKVPRKSTSIDMTAMCDVAFLLLSFFIFTAKFKKPEEIEIKTPNSVSTDSVTTKDRFNVYVEVSPKGKVLMGFETDSVARLVLQALNGKHGIGMNEPELIALSKKTTFGGDFKNLKQFASQIGAPDAAKEPEGIPVMDSTKSQFLDWIIAADSIYQNFKGFYIANSPNYARTIYIRADKGAPYKVVDKVMNVFAKNGMDQFKLVTTPDDAPVGTALYEQRKKEAGK